MEKFYLPERKKDSHKGTYGHLFVIGGSPGLTGAVCLTSMAALRTGCGMVTAGVPESLNDVFEIKLTEVMTKPLSETGRRTIGPLAVDQCTEFIEKIDGLVIGPGISTEFGTELFFKNLIPKISKPMVIDADGLKLLARNLDILENPDKKIILTPHPGEMSYLTGLTIPEIQKNREKVASEFAKKYNVMLVLKGYRTVVADGSNIFINKTGNPGMATAGSGDVLAGIIGSLIVQGFSLWESATMGVYLHGLAGDLAAKKIGEYSLIAGDIIDFLPQAIKKIQKKR
ncbi:MAG: NAD(P)H-hydrate dehydratase [Candidatus Omnitrophica bacterium]|nr:NAD(P)H-hydrate dehydratase [Candidatus Omnitrophota bacterium]MCM8816294.1 NAD(P)H-hydrate dehydratase [Candidatus Omnitrophota bacterium]